MKKITYSLNFGIIGSKKSAIDFGKKIFLEYFKKITVKGELPEDFNINEGDPALLIIFKEIPIRIRIFTAESFNDIINNYERIRNIDVLILLLNIFELDSINSLKRESFEEFKDYFSFRNGVSILTGINMEGDNSSEDTRISRSQLTEKAKELDVLYGYELTMNEKENSEFFAHILSDFIFRFQYSSPELFDLAKLYGNELMEKSN